MYKVLNRNWLFTCSVNFFVKRPFPILQAENIHSDQSKKMDDAAMDSAVPNDKWLKQSVELFNQLNEMGDDWKRYYRNTSVGTDGSRLFQRSVSDEPEKLFQYVSFHNAKLQCMKAVVQFGLYTRGPVGLVHGGAIATILDVAMGNCIYNSGYRSVTGNLNTDYIRPIPLNTTTLVEAKIDKIEGRKIFASGAIKTVDGCEIYSKATSIFIMPQLKASV